MIARVEGTARSYAATAISCGVGEKKENRNNNISINHDHKNEDNHNEIKSAKKCMIAILLQSKLMR